MNTVKQTVEVAPPASLVSKLLSILEPHSLRKLSHDFEVLSKETKEFELVDNSGKIVRYDSKRSLAYMAFRMVPAYGCVHAALTRLRDMGFRFPSNDGGNSNSITVLDFGAGPGTASWAAKHALQINQMETTLIENSLPMIDAAKRLAEGEFETNWARNLLELSRSYTRRNAARYDMVLATFALGDLASDEARQVTVDALWSFCKPNGGVLVIVERGTPRGSRIVGNARKQILAGGADSEFDCSSLFKPSKPGAEGGEPEASFPHVLAPCGHERTCPLLDANSAVAKFSADMTNAAPTKMHCHFVQSTARLLKTTTSVRSSHFTSYSYVAIQKMPQASDEFSHYRNFVRVLAPPKRRINHVLMDVCGERDGKVRQTITKRKDGKLRYKRARKAQYGDLYPRREG